MKNIIKWFALLMHKDMQNFEMKNKSGKKKNTTVADTTDSNKPPHDGMIYDVDEGTWIDMPEVHPDGFDRSAAEEVWSYVNAERTAAGLNALTWDEDIYNFACQRAQAIVSDFSHNGCGNYGENIALNSAGSAYRIHMQWFYSTGHHKGRGTAEEGIQALQCCTNAVTAVSVEKGNGCICGRAIHPAFIK